MSDAERFVQQGRRERVLTLGDGETRVALRDAGGDVLVRLPGGAVKPFARGGRTDERLNRDLRHSGLLGQKPEVKPDFKTLTLADGRKVQVAREPGTNEVVVRTGDGRTALFAEGTTNDALRHSATLGQKPRGTSKRADSDLVVSRNPSPGTPGAFPVYAPKDGSPEAREAANRLNREATQPGLDFLAGFAHDFFGGVVELAGRAAPYLTFGNGTTIPIPLTPDQVGLQSQNQENARRTSERVGDAIGDAKGRVARAAGADTGSTAFKTGQLAALAVGLFEGGAGIVALSRGAINLVRTGGTVKAVVRDVGRLGRDLGPDELSGLVGQLRALKRLSPETAREILDHPGVASAIRTSLHNGGSRTAQALKDFDELSPPPANKVAPFTRRQPPDGGAGGADGASGTTGTSPDAPAGTPRTPPRTTPPDDDPAAASATVTPRTPAPKEPSETGTATAAESSAPRRLAPTQTLSPTPQETPSSRPDPGADPRVQPPRATAGGPSPSGTVPWHDPGAGVSAQDRAFLDHAYRNYEAASGGSGRLPPADWYRNVKQRWSEDHKADWDMARPGSQSLGEFADNEYPTVRDGYPPDTRASRIKNPHLSETELRERAVADAKAAMLNTLMPQFRNNPVLGPDGTPLIYVERGHIVADTNTFLFDRGDPRIEQLRTLASRTFDVEVPPEGLRFKLSETLPPGVNLATGRLDQVLSGGVNNSWEPWPNEVAVQNGRFVPQYVKNRNWAAFVIEMHQKTGKLPVHEIVQQLGMSGVPSPFPWSGGRRLSVETMEGSGVRPFEIDRTAEGLPVYDLRYVPMRRITREMFVNSQYLPSQTAWRGGVFAHAREVANGARQSRQIELQTKALQTAIGALGVAAVSSIVGTLTQIAQNQANRDQAKFLNTLPADVVENLTPLEGEERALLARLRAGQVALPGLVQAAARSGNPDGEEIQALRERVAGAIATVGELSGNYGEQIGVLAGYQKSLTDAGKEVPNHVTDRINELTVREGQLSDTVNAINAQLNQAGQAAIDVGQTRRSQAQSERAQAQSEVARAQGVVNTLGSSLTGVRSTLEQQLRAARQDSNDTINTARQAWNDQQRGDITNPEFIQSYKDGWNLPPAVNLSTGEPVPYGQRVQQTERAIEEARDAADAAAARTAPQIEALRRQAEDLEAQLRAAQRRLDQTRERLDGAGGVTP